MRVKKRVKRGVKKGIKRVKSAPPEAYLAGVGVLVGGAAVLLLATTKSGQELLIRTAQLVLRPEADEQEPQEEGDTSGDDESEVPDLKPRKQRPRKSEVQEDVQNEPAGDADVEEEEETNGDEESEVTDLKPPRSPRKPPAPRQATNA
jgi:hypothetical protein